MHTHFLSFVSLLLIAAFANACTADGPSFPLLAKRIVFLGDSNTFAGGFVSVVESQLIASGVDQRPEIINLGLSSETCSGLTEPSHPFPRPNVHERLGRALEKLKPDVVVACYGMNDGIYYPLDNDRFATYQAGVNLLIETVHAAGAKLVLMTPPPYDALPMREKGKLLPAGAAEYSWNDVYENYDDVMKTYADWIVKQLDRVEMVIDLHTPVTEHLKAERATNPKFVMSGDGVHVDDEGHRVIGEAIVKAWGITPKKLDPTLLKLVRQRQQLMRDAWLSEIGHQRPGIAAGLPIEEAITKASAIDRQIHSHTSATGIAR
jgi:lysophospholipase L1-like esterase